MLNKVTRLNKDTLFGVFKTFLQLSSHCCADSNIIDEILLVSFSKGSFSSDLQMIFSCFYFEWFPANVTLFQIVQEEKVL